MAELAEPLIDEADLEIAPDPEGVAAAIALTTLRRRRTAEHEEMWVQFFVDGVFEDVRRAIDDDSAFHARFRVPAIYRDGLSHRVHVRFVRAVSRIVPKGTVDAFGSPMVQTPEAMAEIDFVATSLKR